MKETGKGGLGMKETGMGGLEMKETGMGGLGMKGIGGSYQGSTHAVFSASHARDE